MNKKKVEHKIDGKTYVVERVENTDKKDILEVLLELYMESRAKEETKEEED